jgi:hypothetical protein
MRELSALLFMSTVAVALGLGRGSRFLADVAEGAAVLGRGLTLPDLASFIMLQNMLTRGR